MASGFVDMAQLRQRIREAVDRICAEEGLDVARVSVDVARAMGSDRRRVSIEIDEQYRDVDATDPKWEDMRGGKKWQDN